MKMNTPHPHAVEQYRLWEMLDFDPDAIKKILERQSKREAERIKRRMCTRIPRGMDKFRRQLQRTWEKAEAERIAEQERHWARQEAMLRDPGHSDEERAAARLAIAGRMYREFKEKFREGV